MERITQQQYEDALELVKAFEEQDIELMAKGCKYKVEQIKWKKNLI